MDNATARPWKIHSLVRFENFHPQVKSFDRYIECEPTSEDQKYAERAVNSHDALVEALGIAEAIICVNRERFPVNQNENLIKIRTALNLAKGA